MSNPVDDPLSLLPPELIGYETEHFALAGELGGLARVQRAGAAEAEIFYAARILEALAADALAALRLPATPNVFANLEVLQQLGLLSPTTCQWAHALRRTGNAVRHLQRRVGPEDAEVAVLFAERWLFWFFRDFAHGPRLAGLAPDGLCLRPGGAASRALIKALEEGLVRPEDLAHAPAPGGPAALRAPALRAVAAEILLERNDLEGAHDVLAAALGAFPDDLRLNQLMGLYWSRAGELDRARAWLEPLYRKHYDDDETAGITAGVYKRLWRADPAGRDWLLRSHRAYSQGWERSRRTNAYLGINAATTALWLGQEAAARDLAHKMHGLLTQRAAALAGRGAGRALAYWDQVTLAEALVLLRDFPAARDAYRQALERHPNQRAAIQVTREQLEHVLKALGLPERADDFLGFPFVAAPAVP